MLNQTASGSNVISMLEQSLPQPGLSMNNYQGQGLTVADINNDGLPDTLIAVGNDALGIARCAIFEQISGGGWNVVEPFGINQGLANASVVAADIEADGDADVIISGVYNNQTSLVLLQNTDSTTTKAAAGARPMSTVTNPSSNLLTIQWSPATDDTTPTTLLRYEVLVEATASLQNRIVFLVLLSTIKSGTPFNNGNVAAGVLSEGVC